MLPRHSGGVIDHCADDIGRMIARISTPSRQVAGSTAPRLVEFPSMHVAMTLWGFAKLACRGDRQFLAACAGRARTVLARADSANLANLSWALAKLQWAGPPAT